MNYTSEQIVRAIKMSADLDILGTPAHRWATDVVDWADQNLTDYEKDWLGGWVE
jgi:hypothetical protein